MGDEDSISINVKSINSIGKYELQVIIIKPEEWSRKGKKEDPFYYEVISNGIPLYGKMPLWT